MPVAAPNFRVASPSGWIVFNSDSGYKTLHLNGRTFVATLQRDLRASPQLLTSARTYDGTSVRGTDVNVDGVWGPMTYKALWAAASAGGAAAVLLAAIETAARARVVNLATMTIAANAVISPMGYPRPGSRIAANAALPLFGVAPPGNETPWTVTDATPDELSAVGASASTTGLSTTGSTTTGTTGTTTGGSDTTTTGGKTPTDGGTDTGVGNKTPVGGPLPTGGPTSIVTSSGISWGPILATVGVIAAVGLLGYSLMSSGGSGGSPRRGARANPRQYGPNMARVYLFRERLDRGGYTSRGVYFGVGEPLYRVVGDDLVDRYGRVHGYVDEHIRGATREAAMRKVQEKYPNVRFVGRG